MQRGLDGEPAWLKRVDAYMDKHILIVEDEPLLALDLESLIAELVEADFVVCRLAADALHEVETKAFDFAFLDVDVVDGTTFDVAQALAMRGERFAFVSGSNRRDDALRCGAMEYLSKPYRPSDIQRVLRRGLLAAA